MEDKVLKWIAPEHVAGVPLELCHIPPRDATLAEIEQAGYSVEQLLASKLWQEVESLHRELEEPDK